MVKELKKQDGSAQQNSRKGRRSTIPKKGGDATDQFLQTSPAKPAAPKHQRKAKSERTVSKAPEKSKAQPSSHKGPPVKADTAPTRRTPSNRKETKNERQRVDATVKADPNAKLRIIPLGGLSEVGKNITAIECNNDIIVVDCGMGFPDEDMPGVDLVIPDITYLEENRDRVRGIFLTHGHEDHIGGIPYALRTINPPIYGTRLTLGIIKNKLEEHTLVSTPKLHEVKAGDVIRAGCMSVEFIHVNHSIADACALCIKTPLGNVIHSGDFKLDTSPIEGEMMDLTRLGELGREGVLLLMCESTNAERGGFTPSERKVGESLEYIFTKHPDKRLVIATFSSNVHRVQQIIDISARHGRKVAVTGRSMTNIVGAAVELGYMNVPSSVLVDINDIKRYRPEELTIVTTGSQGEPMSALYRMAYSDHSQITLGANDLVVLSASAIPGNEKLVGRVINELTRSGIKVMHEAAVAVHVSGHACQEEIKLMIALTKPKYYMPIHGEYRHLTANRDIALYMGVESHNIFVSDIGRVLEIDRKGARLTNEEIPSGRVLVDGYGVGDVGNIVLRDRLHLAQDGLIVVVATIDEYSKQLLSGPDIVSRGFVYVRESETLMDEVRAVAQSAMQDALRSSGTYLDRTALKKRVKDDMTRFLYSKTKRKPMILPVIMDV
ncbi:MAG: RNase J family beta-CASP ribonuclease [Clostridia bacterium]|nr:RNase J family beta-CASP ribonuclease [Clostridia bacterium]